MYRVKLRKRQDMVYEAIKKANKPTTPKEISEIIFQIYDVNMLSCYFIHSLRRLETFGLIKREILNPKAQPANRKSLYSLIK